MVTPAASGSVWCIVVAGGSGRRFGAAKQFEALDGVRIIDRSVATARAACDGVVVVVPAAALGTPAGVVAAADRVVAGGDTRAASVRAGLDAVPPDAGVVLVHDAARPLAPVGLFQRVVAAVRAGAVAVVPAVAVTDTIRQVGAGVVDRDGLRAVQTPQGFSAEALRAAHAGGDDATDDAGLVERAGATVVLVDGEPTNLKVTDAHDLVVAQALLRAGASVGNAAAGNAAAGDPVPGPDGGDSTP